MRSVRTPHLSEVDTSCVAGVDDVEQQFALGPAFVLARRKRCVVTVAGLQVLVIFHRRRFTVLRNRCPHLGADLADARVCRGTLTCPVHRHRYSLDDGAFKSTPGWTATGDPLTVFLTQVVDRGGGQVPGARSTRGCGSHWTPPVPNCLATTLMDTQVRNPLGKAALDDRDTPKRVQLCLR